MCWCLSIIELKNARWNIENSEDLVYTAAEDGNQISGDMGKDR